MSAGTVGFLAVRSGLNKHRQDECNIYFYVGMSWR